MNHLEAETVLFRPAEWNDWVASSRVNTSCKSQQSKISNHFFALMYFILLYIIHTWTSFIFPVMFLWGDLVQYLMNTGEWSLHIGCCSAACESGCLAIIQWESILCEAQLNVPPLSELPLSDDLLGSYILKLSPSTLTNRHLFVLFFFAICLFRCRKSFMHRVQRKGFNETLGGKFS